MEVDVQILRGDIWKLATPSDWICVTTNIGWRRDSGDGIMRAGIAGQAHARHPILESQWGRHCQVYGDQTPIMAYEVRGTPRGLLLVPTVPLDRAQPWLSWKQGSSLKLVRRALDNLVSLAQHPEQLLSPVAPDMRILVPPLGQGCGRLSPDDVQPLFDERNHDRLVLVRED